MLLLPAATAGPEGAWIDADVSRSDIDRHGTLLDGAGVCQGKDKRNLTGVAWVQLVLEPVFCDYVFAHSLPPLAP